MKKCILSLFLLGTHIAYSAEADATVELINQQLDERDAQDCLEFAKEFLKKGEYTFTGEKTKNFEIAARKLLETPQNFLVPNMENICNDHSLFYTPYPEDTSSQYHHFFTALYNLAASKDTIIQEKVRLYKFFYDVLYILHHKSNESFINFLFNNPGLTDRKWTDFNATPLTEAERLFIIKKLFNYRTRATNYKNIILNIQHTYNLQAPRRHDYIPLVDQIQQAAVAKHEQSIVDFLEQEKIAASLTYKFMSNVRSVVTSFRSRVAGFFTRLGDLSQSEE